MFHFQTFRGTILIKPKLGFISDPLWRGATAARARTATQPPRPSDLKSRGLSEGPQEERDTHGEADGAWSHSEGPPHPGGRAKGEAGAPASGRSRGPLGGRASSAGASQSPHITVRGRSGAGADALPCPTLRLSAPTSCAALGLRTGGRVNERPPSLPPSLRQAPGQQAGWGGDAFDLESIGGVVRENGRLGPCAVVIRIRTGCLGPSHHPRCLDPKANRALQGPGQWAQGSPHRQNAQPGQTLLSGHPWEADT